MTRLYGEPMEMPDDMFGGYDKWPPDEITYDEMDLLIHVECVFETSKGKFKVRLFPDHSPIHSANLVRLIQDGYYDGLPFFQVEAGVIAMTGRGENFLNYTLKREKTFLHTDGSVGMDAAKEEKTKESSPSIIYFCLAEEPCRKFDMKRNVFGRVVRGREVVAALKGPDGENAGDFIIRTYAHIPYKSPAFDD